MWAEVDKRFFFFLVQVSGYVYENQTKNQICWIRNGCGGPEGQYCVMQRTNIKGAVL